MKYKHNHPSKELGIALDLDKKTISRLDGAINKAFSEAMPINGTLAFDDFIVIVAPYLRTPEEAFYAAINMTAYIQTALKGRKTN